MGRACGNAVVVLSRTQFHCVCVCVVVIQQSPAGVSGYLTVDLVFVLDLHAAAAIHLLVEWCVRSHAGCLLSDRAQIRERSRQGRAGWLQVLYCVLAAGTLHAVLRAAQHAAAPVICVNAADAEWDDLYARIVCRASLPCVALCCLAAREGLGNAWVAGRDLQ